MQTPLMSQRRRNRFTITEEQDCTLISLGDMEIWDGADLALIRDTLFEQILEYKRRKIAIDMQTVKYIPSGFFGMLGEWRDRGINICIYGVQENVAQMLWFQQFFTETRPGCFQLEIEPKFEMGAVICDEEADDQMTELPATEVRHSDRPTEEDWSTPSPEEFAMDADFTRRAEALLSELSPAGN